MLYRAKLDVLYDVVVCIAAVELSSDHRVSVPHRCRRKVIRDGRIHALIIAYRQINEKYA